MTRKEMSEPRKIMTPITDPDAFRTKFFDAGYRELAGKLEGMGLAWGNRSIILEKVLPYSIEQNAMADRYAPVMDFPAGFLVCVPFNRGNSILMLITAFEGGHRGACALIDKASRRTPDGVQRIFPSKKEMAEYFMLTPGTVGQLFFNKGDAQLHLDRRQKYKRIEATMRTHEETDAGAAYLALMSGKI